MRYFGFRGSPLIYSCIIIATMKNYLTLAAILIGSGTFLLARAAEYVRVAYDDAGVADKQPHLVGGGDWRFENPGTSAEAVRTAAFGERVEFGYTG